MNLAGPAIPAPAYGLRTVFLLFSPKQPLYPSGYASGAEASTGEGGSMTLDETEAENHRLKTELEGLRYILNSYELLETVLSNVGTGH